MTNVYSIDQMRVLEAAADGAGHSYDAMMEAAAAGVVAALIQSLGDLPRATVVLAGPGNNGGDGLVVARLLRGRGWPVAVGIWNRERDERRVVEALEAGATPIWAEEDSNQDQVRQALAEAEVAIDALFGTGLSREIEGLPARLLHALAEASQPVEPRSPLTWIDAGARYLSPLHVVAVDTPSGIHGDTGAVDLATVAADLTVTFAGPKLGLLTEDAASVVGRLVVADIGIPPAVEAAAARVAQCLTPCDVAPWLPERPPTGHKGTFGTVTIIGGSGRYVGAPALSARAAGRSGAGLVELAVPHAIFPQLATQSALSTATWRPLPDEEGALTESALPALEPALERANALVLGPGLGTATGTRHLVRSLIERDDLPPTVVDADALNLLAQTEAWWEAVSASLVLTPHPGEMGRLLNRSTRAVQADRLSVAQEAAERWGQVVVLKGAFTVVAAPDGRAAIAPYANNALAKAGSGDILAGLIGALLAQGVSPWRAASVGIVAHALAGAIVRRQTGGRSALASDLLPMLGSAWAALEESATAL